jgi:hypothetical protein
MLFSILNNIMQLSTQLILLLPSLRNLPVRPVTIVILLSQLSPIAAGTENENLLMRTFSTEAIEDCREAKDEMMQRCSIQ